MKKRIFLLVIISIFLLAILFHSISSINSISDNDSRAIYNVLIKNEFRFPCSLPLIVYGIKIANYDKLDKTFWIGEPEKFSINNGIEKEMLLNLMENKAKMKRFIGFPGLFRISKIDFGGPQFKFSRIGYNEDKNMAIVIVEYNQPLAGFGLMYFFEKKDNKWEINKEKMRMLWMS